MQKRTKKHNIKRKILSALITSAISAAMLNPLAFALPVQDTNRYATTDVKIEPYANNLQMDISSAADNNVINWKEFNIAKNETVAFDAKKYLNLINDSKMSEIWGKLTGKSGGSIYLINPHGILFGKGATVDVGTLYASTREISNTSQSDFESSGTLPALTAATGDIINMGTLKAAQNITLEGNNIVIKGNDSGISDITAKNGEIHFVVNAGGSVQVGAVSGDDTKGYTIKTDKHQSGTIDTTTDFKLVRTLDELQAINNKGLSGKYMLAGDIDGSTSTNFTPIGQKEGTSFKGRFNGLNYSINDLVIEGTKTGVGLFGWIGSGGIVERVGRIGGSTTLTGNNDVGAIAGYNNGGTIRNVFNTGKVNGNQTGAGGIVGKIGSGGLVENARNIGEISATSNVGGIVGFIEKGDIKNVRNEGKISGNDKNIGGIAGLVGLFSKGTAKAGTIENAKNEGNVSGINSQNVGGIVGNLAIGSIENVENKGAVTVTVTVAQDQDVPEIDDPDSKNIGGIAGLVGFVDKSKEGTIKNAKNEGGVSGTKSQNVGGIVGNLAIGSIENVENKGAVTVAQDQDVQEIVGVKGDTVSVIEGTYDDSWEAELTSTEKPYSSKAYIPFSATPSSGGSTTPTSTDTDTSSDDDYSTDTDTTPTIPTTPTTPTVPLTPTTPTTPVEETTPQTPTVEPTVAPTPAESEPVAPIIEPKTEPVSPTVTQTATTTLEEVLQSVGKTQEGGNTPTENITMKTLTEAENAAAANAQTATNSPMTNSSAANPAAQIPQTSTDTVTTTTTISTSSDSSTTSTPSKQSAPSVSTTSTRNTSSASSDNNASANATIITDDKLSIVNQGENIPTSMSVDAVAAQESKSANAANTADTTQSVETSQNNEDKNEQ